MDLIKLMSIQNFAILDVEYIATSRYHNCIRKVHILSKDGLTKSTKEFYPCKKYNEIESKYQRTFLYCRRFIHKLSYNPRMPSLGCHCAKGVIKDFITSNNINFITFKGGTIEKNICESINVPAYNIEILDIEKAECHDPVQEVEFYYNQLRKKGFV